MPPRGSPNIHARQLATELRSLRQRAKLTGQQAAQQLNWPASKISRIETGVTKQVKEQDLRSLLDLYAVPDQRRRDLLALLRNVDVGPAGYGSGFGEYLDAEARAVSIWEWEPQVIPGLLQTADYARASMIAWNYTLSLPTADLDVKVDTRLARQQVLTSDKAPCYRVVLDEAVLHRLQGDNSTMRVQLQRVADRAGLPNVELRVLPFGSTQRVNTGSFVYMRFSEDRLPRDVVFLEQLSGTNYIDDVELTKKYQLVFDRLEADSLAPGPSIQLIRSIALAYEDIS